MRSAVRSRLSPPKQYNPNPLPIGHGFGFVVFMEEVEDWYSRYGFLFRRICSSRPCIGEQRRQSLAALTARGRGLDCFQPQPEQPVLRRNKLRIFRFHASVKAQALRLFLPTK